MQCVLNKSSASTRDRLIRRKWTSIFWLLFETGFYSRSAFIRGNTVYIYWDARHVRPLTFNTHIFCQFYSMQQHADSIIRVNGLVQVLMEVRDPEVSAIFFKRESKRRPNSICMFTSSSSAASSSLPCALSDVDVYDVSLRSNYITYTYKNLPQCCCSVHANNLSCIQLFQCACAFEKPGMA